MRENALIVPIENRPLLNVEDAASYFGIGVNKIRELTDGDRCPHVLWVGKKRMIKRQSFELYLLGEYSV